MSQFNVGDKVAVLGGRCPKRGKVVATSPSVQVVTSDSEGSEFATSWFFALDDGRCLRTSPAGYYKEAHLAPWGPEHDAQESEFILRLGSYPNKLTAYEYGDESLVIWCQNEGDSGVFPLDQNDEEKLRAFLNARHAKRAAEEGGEA